MNTLVLIIQGLLSLFFIMPGYGKVKGSKQKHVADGHLMASSSILPIRILGVLELLGCVGIILPWTFGILPVLTPITAVCFCIIMFAGMIVHFRKREYKMLPMLILVFLLSSGVAFYRFMQLK
ncbi:DoxX family protein [Chryseobacterium sp. CKR4-1]|uniref:DoxX family protein n=1 Tax=Chryseobacterium sp. CKR4-1 TaxID=3068896 RepID=UPI0027968D14|nr:DoxX family protein [Chryseobacterium sp. CKR4-1]MDQ1805081.1 DoxX family protein [Chryseobacterium sp. CKR4-1]